MAGLIIPAAGRAELVKRVDFDACAQTLSFLDLGNACNRRFASIRCRRMTDLSPPLPQCLARPGAIHIWNRERCMAGLWPACWPGGRVWSTQPLGQQRAVTIRNLIRCCAVLLCLSGSLAYASATGADVDLAPRFLPDRPP